MNFDSLTKAGTMLGLGLGGFFDGIVLHQILQWHHLVCITEHCQPTSIEHLKMQNTQDGFFHLAVWILTIIGAYMLFKAAQKREKGWDERRFTGAMLMGWGIFNFAEGLIDHQILGIHHVLPGHPNQFLFDMLFLASGLILGFVGWRMTQMNTISA
ncbi:MAG TPA: DUF2243 domain-containing protein [Patescibacteria group bacterium]|nr:DUF2243 domain-containing protein [Patescibacteria group bacterium]